MPTLTKATERTPLEVLKAITSRIRWMAGDLTNEIPGTSLEVVRLLDEEGLVEFSQNDSSVAPWYSVHRLSAKGTNGLLANLPAILSSIGSTFRIRATALGRDVVRIHDRLSRYAEESETH